ncbi:MAG: hypothetical protein V1729_05835 [Candidatus Woesearchaeota archaeon]
MGCYAVPAVAAVVHWIMKKKIPSWNTDKYHSWLTKLLAGGAIFGIVDHAWNGELFFVGENLLLDLALGVTITLTIFAVWGVMVVADRAKVKAEHRAVQ